MSIPVAFFKQYVIKFQIIVHKSLIYFGFYGTIKKMLFNDKTKTTGDVYEA